MMGSVSMKTMSPVVRIVFSGRKPTSGDIGAEKREKTMSDDVKECSNEVPAPKPAVQPDMGFSCRPKRGASSKETMKREKFSVSLSRKEIEEDFMAIINQLPPRRPKKRNKVVQNQIDNLFPGFDLTEVTADMYKVSDSDSGKKVKKKKKASKSKSK